MDKKFAIFDMDGTLVDSMSYWDDIFREYLEAEGVQEGLPDALERIRPKTLMEAAVYLVERFDLKRTADDVIGRMNEMMADHYVHHVALKPGVWAYLEELRKNQVKMCVASATTAPLMRLCLEKREILPYFEFFLSCEEVGKGKDQPDVYLTAAKRLGAAAADEVAVFEDSFHAASTAHKAGFYVVGIYDDCGKELWKEMKVLADEHRIWGE